MNGDAVLTANVKKLLKKMKLRKSWRRNGPETTAHRLGLGPCVTGGSSIHRNNRMSVTPIAVTNSVSSMYSSLMSVPGWKISKPVAQTAIAAVDCVANSRKPQYAFNP